MQLGGARDDNSYINNATVEVCPHRKQIAIKGLILAIPFQIAGYLIFQKINIVPVNIALDLHLVIGQILKMSPLFIGGTRILEYG